MYKKTSPKTKRIKIKNSSKIKRQKQESIEERLQFEMLISDISARFINLPADQIDTEIESAQRDVCEFLGLDVSTLWQCLRENPDYMMLTHYYRPLGGPPPPEPMNAHDYFPWSLKQLNAGKVVVISSVDELPTEASRDKEVYHHFGVKTGLSFPLSSGGGHTIGALSFNDMRK